MISAEELRGSTILMVYFSKEAEKEWRKDVLEVKDMGEEERKRLLEPRHGFHGVVERDGGLYYTGKVGRILEARVRGKEIEPERKCGFYLVEVDDVKEDTLYGRLSRYERMKVPLNERVEVKLSRIKEYKDCEGKEVMFLGPGIPKEIIPSMSNSN